MEYAFYRKITDGWKFADYGELTLENLKGYVSFHEHIQDSDIEYLVLNRELNVPFTLDINTAIKRFQIDGFNSIEITPPNSSLKFTIVSFYDDLVNFGNSIGAK